MPMEGFQNFGNTCYFNAALQCILHCPQLTMYTLHDIYKEDLNKRKKYASGFVEAYKALVDSYWMRSGKTGESLQRVREWFLKQHKSFDNERQHDAHEAILCMLNTLHEGLGKTKPIAGSKATPILDAQSLEAWKANNESNYSILTEIFQSQFQVDIASPEYTNTVYDHSFDLSVPPLPRLEDAIRESLKPETGIPYKLDDGRKIKITRTQRPTYLPLILVIHLKRFNAKRKLDSLVEYPEKMDLSFVTGRGEDFYALFGVVLHSGSRDCGHYVALNKVDDKWLCYNDSVVSSVETPHHSNAYVLLYKKVPRT